MRLSAKCLPGLEDLLAQELQTAGISSFFKNSPTPKNAGSITFHATHEELFQCQAQLGTATSLFLHCCGTPNDLPAFHATGLAELRRKVSQIQWKDLLLLEKMDSEKRMLQIRVTSSKSRLFHTKAVAERVEQGIYDSLQIEHAVAQSSACNTEPPIHILVQILRDQVQVLLDTSSYGIPLHRRGYRLETAKAPLREDIARSIIQVCFQNIDSTARNTVIIDPFCGSGTIAIEAAAYIMNTSPGRLRAPPLFGTTLYDETMWKKTIASSFDQQNHRSSSSSFRIFASDRDEGAVQAAKRNSQRANVDHLIDFQCYSVSDAFANFFNYLESLPQDKPRNVFVITNPPFGKRISATRAHQQHKDLLPLYQTLGKYVNQIKDCKLGVIVHDVKLAHQTAVPSMKVQFTTSHGGLPVSFLLSS